jgi:hypothetical protein
MKCKYCNVTGCPNRGSNAEFSSPCTVINQDSFDWQSFRNQAAKDILCAMLTDQRISETMPYKDLVRMSLECTDELIKQLKEKEEK